MVLFYSWCAQIVLQQTILHLTIVELTLISRCLPTKHPQLITCFPTLDKTSRISLVGMFSAHLISSVISSMFGLSESQPILLWSYSLKITIGKEEKTKTCVLLTRVCYTLCSVFRVPIENLTRGRLYPYQMIVPKFKCILFGFHKNSWFIAKVTFASIPSNIENCRMHIFLHLVDNLQTPKTRISFFWASPSRFRSFPFLYLAVLETRIWRN